MECSILAIALSDELVSNLEKMIAQYKLHIVTSPTIQVVNRSIYYQAFHLIIANLDHLRGIRQVDWLAGIRRNAFALIIILSDLPENGVAVIFCCDYRVRSS